MLGTIVNTCCIIIGSIAGSVMHKGIKEKYKKILFDSLGLASVAIGLNATISNFKGSEYPVLFIIALAVGGVIGTALDIDGRFRSVVNRHSKSGRDLGQGLATATLLYCIGPLSMLGPMLSALKGDNTFLFTNATLDLVSSMVFASTYGIGIILAAVALFLWQGAFYLNALMSSSAISPALMSELLIIGGLMITASGLSVLKVKDIKTLNMLPALLVPIVWFAIKWIVENL